ncbi:MAG: Fic family protein [Blastocatellia bacterium]|nr:Fic family protein [Blastocatellia bacterium]
MYHRIAPLPDEWEEMASSELASLRQVWQERRAALQDGVEYQEFLKKLRREWAIETGIIERLYSWDRGVTEILIEQGIDASLIASRGGVHREEADRIWALIEDQQAIIDALFAFIRNEQPLTEHFIRSMHQQFTAHQDSTEALTHDGKMIRVELLRGEYKRLPNNPRRPDGQMHEYCPPNLVSDEMAQLVIWHEKYEEAVPPEMLSAWLHHRFTQIHPFQDGNGRVARALASLVFLRKAMFPLVVRDADRREYIEALERADQEDLGPLVKLFAGRQKDSILKALGIEQQARQARHAEEIIASTIRVLEEKAAASSAQRRQVFSVADGLGKIAFTRIEDIAQTIDLSFQRNERLSTQPYSARADFAEQGVPQSNYFFNQIVEIAKRFDYYANLDAYRSWIRLSIQTEERFEYVISLHGYGPGVSGIMIASAFTARRVPREGGGTEFFDTQPAATDLFQFNYAEAGARVEARFRDWLEDSLAIALSEWRRFENG